MFHGRQSVRNLDIQPDEKISKWEFGTGWPCRCTPPLRIVGIDFSEGMLDQAKQRAAAHQMDVCSCRMDAGAMEFKDDSFDTVVAAYVVTAVPTIAKIVVK